MDHSSGSYILRHWRGELSLARSFWVNCVVVSVVFGLLFLVPVDSFVTHWPRLVSPGAAALYLSSIPLTMWQCVGTWRSAKARAAGGRAFWARVVQGIVATDVVAGIYSTIAVILPISLDYGQVVLGLDPSSDYRVSVSEDGRNLVVDGGIGFGLADAVTEALDRNRGLRTIELWSPGGRLVEARRLAEIIEARALDTLVVDTCASACTLVFIAGNHRELASEARLGFHNGAFPGASEAEARLWQIVDQEYLLRRGVSRDFVRKIYATPFEDLWEPSHQELLRAGVATGHAMAGG